MPAMKTRPQARVTHGRFRCLAAAWLVLLWLQCTSMITTIIVVDAQQNATNGTAAADDDGDDDFVMPATDDPVADVPVVNITVTDDAKATTDDKELANCFTTINGLALQEAGADTSARRIYELCPNSEYGVGRLDYDYVVEGGQEPIPLRPNMHLRCGSDGYLENNCVVIGGDVQLDGTSYLTVQDNDRIDNVTIEGVTFVSAFKYMVWLNKPGSVTFINCLFRGNRKVITPVLLDFFDPKEANDELKVTFQDCTFDDNVYGGSVPMDLAVAGVNRQASLIVGNSQQNRIIIENTVFRNNDMTNNNSEWQSNSFLVESSGPLTMTESCFENNRVGVSMVMSYHPELFLADNFGNESDGGMCFFSAKYTTAEEYQAQVPQCGNYDASECQAYGTPEPSTQPSETPSSAPSGMPTASPKPTGKPSVLSSPAPTTQGLTGSAVSAAVDERRSSFAARMGATLVAIVLLL